MSKLLFPRHVFHVSLYDTQEVTGSSPVWPTFKAPAFERGLFTSGAGAPATDDKQQVVDVVGITPAGDDGQQVVYVYRAITIEVTIAVDGTFIRELVPTIICPTAEDVRWVIVAKEGISQLEVACRGPVANSAALQR